MDCGLTSLEMLDLVPKRNSNFYQLYVKDSKIF